MARLRDKVFENEDEKTFTLTDYEFRYLKDMNQALLLHTLRSALISGFLTYVATTRLGYQSLPEDKALQYEVDLQTDDQTLKIRMVPKDSVPD